MTTDATNPFEHKPDPCVEGECALCLNPAAHKVAEDASDNRGLFRRHPFTNYVCCTCFGRLMGHVAAGWCSDALATDATYQENPNV